MTKIKCPQNNYMITLMCIKSVLEKINLDSLKGKKDHIDRII